MIYETDYLKKNPDWHRSDSIFKANWIYPYIKGEKIAEIGCGSGNILRILAEKYSDKSFTGYEVSKTAYDSFLKTNKPNIQYVNKDFFSDNKKYDQILIIDLIEHLLDPYSFLSSLKNCADQFIFHIPLEYNLMYLLFNKNTDLYNQYGHLHFFDRKFILNILKILGFRVVHWNYSPISMIKINKNRQSKLLNLARSIFFKFNKDLTVKFLGGYSLLCICSQAKP